jgi:hypothetical protein
MIVLKYPRPPPLNLQMKLAMTNLIPTDYADAVERSEEKDRGARKDSKAVKMVKHYTHCPKIDMKMTIVNRHL